MYRSEDELKHELATDYKHWIKGFGDKHQNYDEFDIRHLAWFVAGFFTAISFVLCCILTVDHLNHMHRPHLQVYVVRIVWMVPVYSVNACLGLLTTENAWLWSSMREFYEAFTIWNFFHLLFAMLGGEENTALMLKSREPSPAPWPFCCFGDMDKGRTFLYRVRFGVVQYVAIKPLVTIMTAISKFTKIYGENQWSADQTHIYLLTLTNLSQMVAMYCLVMFYVELRTELSHWSPLMKFMCIKMVVFFTYWQGLALSILTSTGVIKAHTQQFTHFTDIQVAEALQNVCIAVEMMFFALMHHYAFGVRQFWDPRQGATESCPALCHVVSFADMREDLTLMTTRHEYKRLRCCSTEYGTQRVEQHEPLTLASPPDSHLGHAMQLGFGDGEGATPICFTPESGQKFRRVHPDPDYQSSSTSALSGCAGLTQSTNDSIYLDKDRLDSL